TESATRLLREELVNDELFYQLKEAQLVIERWRRTYTTVRPHASLGYRPPAPEVFMPAFTAWPAAIARPAPPAKLTVVERPTAH
ncbi:transposase, partial [Methylobacterium sp. J-048]|uniref:transposase n=1 Tax=Methylobacterium sp. J-048 TaxID=2836635 RepID=UPI001FB8A77E